MRGILEIYREHTEHRKKEMISATSAKRRQQLQMYHDCRHLAGEIGDTDREGRRLIEFLEEMIDFIEDLEDDEDNSDSFE